MIGAFYLGQAYLGEAVGAAVGAITGSLAAAETPDAFAAPGSVTMAGPHLAATETTDSVVADGSVLVSGTLAASEAPDRLVVVGRTAAATPGGRSFTAWQRERIVGHGEMVSEPAEMMGLGAVRIVATAATEAAPAALTGRGAIRLRATGTNELPRANARGRGVVANPGHHIVVIEAEDHEDLLVVT